MIRIQHINRPIVIPVLDQRAETIREGTLFRASTAVDISPRVFLRAYNIVVDLANPGDTYELDALFHNIVELDGTLDVWTR